MKFDTLDGIVKCLLVASSIYSELLMTKKIPESCKECLVMGELHKIEGHVTEEIAGRVRIGIGYHLHLDGLPTIPEES